MFMLARP
jgi:hypothetical protein